MIPIASEQFLTSEELTNALSKDISKELNIF